MTYTSRPPPRRGRRPIHDPPRILVAEDDPEMLEIIIEVLRSDGYEVQGANDGGRMLVQLTKGEKYNYNDVDLIISDINMPIVTGIQIVETLRVAHCDVPIILMTGFGDARTRTHAESLGAVLFDKPFGIEDLRAVVSGLLT